MVGGLRTRSNAFHASGAMRWVHNGNEARERVARLSHKQQKREEERKRQAWGCVGHTAIFTGMKEDASGPWSWEVTPLAAEPAALGMRGEPRAPPGGCRHAALACRGRQQCASCGQHSSS